MSDDKKVIAFPQRGGTPADDLLMSLPEIPEHMMYCGNCGRHADEVKNTAATGWCVGPQGCGDCLTPREIRFLSDRDHAWSSWGAVVRTHMPLLAAARDVIAGKPGAVASLRRIVAIEDDNDRLAHQANVECLERREAYLAAQTGSKE